MFRTLYKLAQESKLPCQNVGRPWRFRMETIRRWLDGQHGDARDLLDHQTSRFSALASRMR